MRKPSGTVLALLAVLFLVPAAWYAFRGTSVIEKAQVSPDVTVFCNSFACKMEGVLDGGLDVTTKPGRTSMLSFACSTVGDGWIAAGPYVAANETSYRNLTGGWSPDDTLYDYDGTLASASAACSNSDHGRLHLFWTFLVLAALSLIAFEVLRRRSLLIQQR